jgi:hypothetical protein
LRRVGAGIIGKNEKRGKRRLGFGLLTTDF